MFKKLTIIAIASLLLYVTTACGESDTVNSETIERPVIYASFYPMYDLAKKAAGELCDVRILIPDGTEPHDWEPSPRDIAELEKADLFVYSNYTFETWAETVIAGINRDKLVVLEASASDFCGNNYYEDPHTWLAPGGARNQFRNICHALQRIDPDNAEQYEENEAFWVREFQKLDAEFAALREAPQKKILVTHGAFKPLCGSYGLEQIAIIDGSPDSEPDPARMAEMVKVARENSITTVFYEEISGARIAQTIADEIGGKIAPLSPLEGLTDAQRENGDDYFSVMRANLAVLKEALA